MGLWFFRYPERLRQERAAITALESSEEWLLGSDWNLGEGLCLNAVIRVNGQDFEVRLIYPSLFPTIPIAVYPVNTKERWSTHQYGGPEGPLCLEYGPDNWHPEVTGATMLESAHRLLELEHGSRTETKALAPIIPTRHHLSLGQKLRGKIARWYQSEGLRHFFKDCPDGSAGRLKFSVRFPGELMIVFVHEVAAAQGEPWRDTNIPQNLQGANPSELYCGVWFVASGADGAQLSSVTTLVALQLIATAAGHKPDLLATNSSFGGMESAGLRTVIVVDSDHFPHLFLLGSEGTTIRFDPVQSGPNIQRIPGDYDVSSKRIGIVGLGSMGSKIAISMARMGVKDFYLVDHDVFLPENLVRHALDWQSVCQHKVDAMALSLQQVKADVNVSVCRTHLTGQESNAVIGAVLKRLGACDLILDATADPRVFNLLSAAACLHSKPLVWAQVFGGGIGGMIARSRPALDPPPLTMRAIYHQYCSEHPAAQQPVPGDYTVEEEEGRVITASDADVAIIGHHTARLAWDTLVGNESQYPNSLYLIGLAKAWVFEAPFAAIPIETATFRESSKSPDQGAELGQDNVDFLGILLEKLNDATPAPM